MRKLASARGHRLGKYRWSLWLVLAGVTALPSLARADTVQIGTITGTAGPVSGEVIFSVTNDTSDANLDVTGYIVDGFNGLANPITVAPGGTLDFLNSFAPTATDSFFGDIASSTFTVAGITYTAANLDWTSPTFLASFTGTIPIDITASPTVATPEPGTLFLVAAGMLVLASLFRANRTSGISKGFRLHG